MNEAQKYGVLTSNGKFIKDCCSGKRFEYETKEDAERAAFGLNRHAVVGEKRARYAARPLP